MGVISKHWGITVSIALAFCIGSGCDSEAEKRRKLSENLKKAGISENDLENLKPNCPPRPPHSPPESTVAERLPADEVKSVISPSSIDVSSVEITTFAEKVEPAAPYYFSRPAQETSNGIATFNLPVRHRKRLEDCDHVLAEAAWRSQLNLARALSSADALARDLLEKASALTREEPDCYTAWDWRAEASFVTGNREEFQRAIGQMIELGLHQSIKRDTWVMLQKALRRGWLDPVRVEVTLNTEPGKKLGSWRIDGPTGAPSGGGFTAIDFTRKTDGIQVVAVAGRMNTLYLGGWDGDNPEGYGVLEDCSGGYFKGNFHGGRPDGKGIGRSADGSWRSGTFRGWQQQETGVFWNPQGQLYLGSFENDIAHGDGTLLDGPILLEGKFVGGAMTTGEVLDIGSGVIGSGQFTRAQLTGIGVCRFPDGSELRGLFDDFQPTRSSWFINSYGVQYYCIGRNAAGELVFRADSGARLYYGEKQ